MAAVLAIQQSLTDWLASDALAFEVLFLSKTNEPQLQEEWSIFELLFHEENRSGRLCWHGLTSKSWAFAVKRTRDKAYATAYGCMPSLRKTSKPGWR